MNNVLYVENLKYEMKNLAHPQQYFVYDCTTDCKVGIVGYQDNILSARVFGYSDCYGIYLPNEKEIIDFEENSFTKHLLVDITHAITDQLNQINFKKKTINFYSLRESLTYCSNSKIIADCDAIDRYRHELQSLFENTHFGRIPIIKTLSNVLQGFFKVIDDLKIDSVKEINRLSIENNQLTKNYIFIKQLRDKENESNAS